MAEKRNIRKYPGKPPQGNGWDHLCEINVNGSWDLFFNFDPLAGYSEPIFKLAAKKPTPHKGNYWLRVYDKFENEKLKKHRPELYEKVYNEMINVIERFS